MITNLLTMKGIICSLLLAINITSILVFAVDTTTNDEVNIGSFEIAKLRNFRVENHYVTTEDGYIINVVRILPVGRSQTTNKRPVIFNHGSSQSSTYFMTNSVGATPIDYSNYNAGDMSEESLRNLLANNKSITTSMPILCACFGHDVWLINRRGTEFSLGRVNKDGSVSNIININRPKRAAESKPFSSDENSSSGSGGGGIFGLFKSLTDGLMSYFNLLTKPQLNLGSLANTFDLNYWNFSLDEQAKYDLPAVINYVLNVTQQEKVAYVGHSFGGVLMLMLQSEHPEWANKVEPFLAWSPDMYLAHSTSLVRPLFLALQPVMSLVTIPFPPTPLDPLTRTLLASLCQTDLNQETVCRLLENSLWGFSGNQQQTKPAFMASEFYSFSSHELVQVAQAFEKGKFYFYDYGPIGNLRAYGSTAAPIYNVGNITSTTISMWHGRDDALSSPSDVKTLISDFSVPIDDRYIDNIRFNHYDILFGKDAPTVINLPSLRLIESYS